MDAIRSFLLKIPISEEKDMSKPLKPVTTDPTTYNLVKEGFEQEVES